MDTFWEFCYGVRNILKPDKPEKSNPPRSGSPISRMAESPVNKYHDCAHVCCVQTTLNLSTWKQVQIRNRIYYLCSQQCWDEWLNSPDYSTWSHLHNVRTTDQ